MVTIKLLMYIVAFLLLLLEALGVKTTRITLGWLGLAIWVLALLLA